MAEILLTPAEARQHAQNVQTASADINGIADRLTGNLSNLTASFKGKTQAAWEARYQELNQSHKQMMESLDSLGRFLREAADTIEQTDAQLASGLG